jgi:hypothetical protein
MEKRGRNGWDDAMGGSVTGQIGLVRVLLYVCLTCMVYVTVFCLPYHTHPFSVLPKVNNL